MHCKNFLINSRDSNSKDNRLPWITSTPDAGGRVFASRWRRSLTVVDPRTFIEVVVTRL